MSVNPGNRQQVKTSTDNNERTMYDDVCLELYVFLESTSALLIPSVDGAQVICNCQWWRKDDGILIIIIIIIIIIINLDTALNNFIHSKALYTGNRV